MSVASKSIKLSDAKRASKARGETIAEFKEELKKVSWTTPEELKMLAKIVVGATVLFGMGTYFADLIVKGALDALSLIVRAIWG